MSFQLLTPDDPQWESLFNIMPAHQQDVFYTPAFARLCQSTLNRDDEVFCAAMTFDENVVMYPFVRRDLARVTGEGRLAGIYDITSMYGRGGVIASLAPTVEASPFHAALADYCRQTGVFCGFDRFHPVIGNQLWAAPGTEVLEIGGFVVVDLRPDITAIEASFKPSVRKDLRKAARNKIVCFAEANCNHLADFITIYNQTMNRNSAAEFYYFSEEYFLALGRELAGHFHFFYAMTEGEIVSCELVLHHGKFGHSFLGGTKREALPLCANPVLKWEIIRDLKERGCEYFLLGGGTRPDDSIFNFKRAYAPEGVLPSRIGGTVWDHVCYERLRREMSSASAGERFQFYDRR